METAKYRHEKVVELVPWISVKRTRPESSRSKTGCLIITNYRVAVLSKASLGKLQKDGTKKYISTSIFTIGRPYFGDALDGLNGYSMKDFNHDIEISKTRVLLLDHTNISMVYKKPEDRSLLGRTLGVLGKPHNLLTIECSDNTAYDFTKYEDTKNGLEPKFVGDPGETSEVADEQYDWDLIVRKIKQLLIGILTEP